MGRKVIVGSSPLLLPCTVSFVDDVSEAARVEGTAAGSSIFRSIDVRWPPTNEVS